MKNKTNTSLILISIITLCVVGCFYYVVTYVSSLSQKSADLKGEIESKQIKINHIQNVNKSAEKTSGDAVKIMEHFIKPDGSIDFISSVESAAADFSLKYNTNSIENVEYEELSSQGKQILKISMSLSGGWKNILKFLTYIESLPYAVRVDKVEMSSGVAVENTETSTVDSSGKASLKAVPTEISWKLSIIFSVVKIKEKK
ncbi:MAG: type 4a pilus biogenesis protein PilO [Candidatus Pacebacteria bacterium]|nr:type 4a pilus biogenesis protein PilO [Candidatus Paceibacterota bacterium]